MIEHTYLPDNALLLTFQYFYIKKDLLLYWLSEIQSKYFVKLNEHKEYKDFKYNYPIKVNFKIVKKYRTIACSRQCSFVICA